MPELIVGFGKGKSPLGKSKDDPMGEEPESDTKPAGEDLDAFDAALEDAFDAVASKDKDAFKEALGAAISAKCAEMVGEKEDE